MFAAIFIGLISVIFIIVGFLVWRTEKISLLHNYHYNKVSDKNKNDFCKLSGLGVIMVGLGLLITAIIIGITDSIWSFIAFIVGFVSGLLLLICAEKKYNTDN